MRAHATTIASAAAQGYSSTVLRSIVVLAALLIACDASNPHDVVWLSRLDIQSHRSDCGFEADPMAPWPPPNYIGSDNYRCIQVADDYVPAIRDNYECLAPGARRRRDCILRTCDPERWAECPEEPACVEPIADELQAWRCVAEACEGDEDIEEACMYLLAGS